MTETQVADAVTITMTSWRQRTLSVSAAAAALVAVINRILATFWRLDAARLAA